MALSKLFIAPFAYEIHKKICFLFEDEREREKLDRESKKE